jgi:peptidoglycan/LPS O-acetylase OafA/YrhL
VKFDNDAVDPHGPSVPWFIKFSEKMGFLRFWPSLTAVCLPASCKARDIEKILESNVVKSYISPMRLSLYSHESLEDSISDFVQYPLLRRVSRIILYSLTVFTLLSTVTLYFIPRSQEEGYDNFLVHFDIISNWKRLVTPSAVTPNNKNMYVFNIAKTMYLFAGIFCHVYTGVFAKSHAYYSGITMHAMDTDFKNDIEWENFGVCVNFVLSGCMASLSLLPLMKARRVALSQAVLLRGLRTLPVVSACILLTLSFPLTSIGSGPLSLLVQINMTENCVKNAWRDLTFTSNFVPFREMCVPVTWFASADMQLFIVSWFLFGVMARGNKKQVVKYFILFLIGGWTAKALFLHLFSIEPVLFVASNDWFTTMKSLTIIQFNSLSYTGPYLVGVILGYLIHKEIFLVNKKYFKYLIAVSFGTIVAIYIMLPKIYDVTDGIRSNYSRKIEILFASTSRTFLCTAFAFLLYAAYMSGVRGEDDQEELVNKESRKELHEVNNNDNGLVCLLKHNVFNILSRLSFSIFMVHMFVIVFFQTSYRQISDFNSADIAMKGLYVSVMSLLPGLLMYLVVEAPFFNIVKSHLGKKIKSKSL